MNDIISPQKKALFSVSVLFQIISFLILFTGTANAQLLPTSCVNSNFSMGDFTDWQGCYGHYANPCQTPGFYLTPPNQRQLIIQGPGTADPHTCGNIMTVFPGEAYSARLGNDNVTGSQPGYGEQMSYDVNVTSDKYLFIYRYAVVLEDNGHPAIQQPNFTIDVLDSVGNLVDPICGHYYVYAQPNLPGWHTCNQSGYQPIRYRDWQTVGMDLTPYLGQHVTIRFITRDCLPGGHFGYAYISAYCSYLQVHTAMCESDTSAILTAPPGFRYLWSTGDTTPSITVPHPVTGEAINCTLTAVNGCMVTITDTLTYTVIHSNFTHGSACTNSLTQFNDSSYVNQNDVVNWRWNFGDGLPEVTGIGNPTHSFANAGTYNVKLVSYSTEGCKDSIIKQVVVDTLPGITNPVHRNQICSNLGTNIILTTNVINALYTWTATASSMMLSGFSDESIPTASPIEQILVNNGTQTDSVTYTIIPHKGMCDGPPFTFRVVVLPMPTAMVTGTIAVCQNAASPVITFTGASGTAPYTFTYHINGLPNQTVTTTVGNSVTVTAPTNVVGIFTYNLDSIQEGSSNACSHAQTGSAVVTVNPLPTATITGTITVCQNSASPLITFTGASATPPYTFTYNINGLPVQTVTTAFGNSVTVVAPTNVVGIFTYNLVSVQDGSSTTCSQAQTGSAVVTVNPLPTATITGTISVCQNSTSPLITFTGASATAPYTFTYNINGLPNQTVTTIVGNSVTVAAPTNIVGTFNYNLVSVQDGSATTCSQAQTGSAVVTVNSLPVIDIFGSPSVCKNSTTVYSTAAGMTNYVWTVSSGGIITVGQGTNTISVNWTAYGAQTITLNYTDANGCTAASPKVLDVVVSDLPVPTLAGDTIICVGSTITYSTDPGNSAYAWVVSAGGTPTAGGGPNDNFVTVHWTVAAPQTISVNYQAGPGCSASSPHVENVTVNPLPTATISGTIDVCQNSASPLITFTGASATAPYTFTYNINGLPNQTVTTIVGNSVTVAAPTNTVGAFTYNLVSVQDGSSTTCSQVQSGAAVVMVNPLPTATISGTIAVCKNSVSPLITFTGASSTAPYTFTYNINGSPVQTVTTIVGNSVTVAAPTNIVGTFTYNLVSVQDGSSTTCSQVQSGSAVVTVNSLPTATISGTIAVCKNSISPLITFTGASTTAPYTFTYNINGLPNQTVTTTVGNSVTVAAPTNVVGTFTYNLVSVQDGSPTTCSQAQAGIAVVTVNPLPTASISGTISLCQNSSSPLITFTGASATAPYTFTYNINGLPNQTVTTTVGNSVTVAAPTNAVGTFTYNLVSVQDGSSTTCTQAQAGSAVITVNPLPTATISGTIAVCKNSVSPLITFTGASSTAPYTFTYNINGLPNQTVTTVVGNSVTVAAPTNIVGSFTYNLVSVQDGSPTTCSQAQSGSAIVTVNPLPTATIAGTIIVCQNSASPLITFTGASTMAPYTFTYNINGLPNQTVTTIVGNSVTVAAPTNVAGTFTYNLVSVQDGSPTSCSQAQAGSAVVTVNPLPTATISGTITVCRYSPWPLITFTGASSTAPYTFTYNINGLPNQTVTTIVGNSVTVAAPTDNLGIFTYNLVSVQDGSATLCSQAQAGSAVVTVSTLPSPTITGLNPICSGIPTTYTTEPFYNNYLWQVSAGGTITAGGGSNDNTVTVMWNTAGAQTVSVNYSMSGCSAQTPYVYNITVKPVPSVTNAANSTTCSNVPISIALFGSLPGTTFSWTATGSSPSVTGFHPGAGFNITDDLINTGFNIENVNYAVTPSLNGCDGQIAHFIVTVNPVADVYFNPNGQSFCSGGTTSINILSHVAGATFTWTATGSSGFVSGYGPGVTNFINQTLTNSGPYFENVNYNVTSTANSCPGTTNNHVVVNMNPTPQVSFDMACNELITTTDAKPFTLRGGIPLGGVYSGPGVNAGIFFPSLAGPGTIPINYSYSNTWGCNANQSQIISVISMAPFNCDNILTDIRDNKQYPTIKIGTQCWMAMNLDLGTQIPSTSMQRDNCVIEKYCNGDIAGNCATMGGLYQWDEMMRFQDIAAIQGICPPGWHVPTETDWTSLFNFYISNGFAGSPLKYTGYSGFNAWLNGVRFDNNLYDFTNFATFLWSSNSDGPSKAWAHAMNTFNPSVSAYPGNRSNAFSVRCIKD
jgi:uncharacterized protein (TIGR02145 family)